MPIHANMIYANMIISHLFLVTIDSLFLQELGCPKAIPSCAASIIGGARGVIDGVCGKWTNPKWRGGGGGGGTRTIEVLSLINLFVILALHLLFVFHFTAQLSSLLSYSTSLSSSFPRIKSQDYLQPVLVLLSLSPAFLVFQSAVHY